MPRAEGSMLIGEGAAISQESAAGDCDAARCRSLFAAALLNHLAAAMLDHAAGYASGLDIAESRSLLTDQRSRQRRERDFLCVMAGVEPEPLRLRVVALLAGDAAARAAFRATLLFTAHGEAARQPAQHAGRRVDAKPVWTLERRRLHALATREGKLAGIARRKLMAQTVPAIAAE